MTEYYILVMCKVIRTFFNLYHCNRNSSETTKCKGPTVLYLSKPTGSARFESTQNPKQPYTTVQQQHNPAEKPKDKNHNCAPNS